jgi:hypothetical protein
VAPPDRGGDRRVEERRLLRHRASRQPRLQEVAAVGHLLGDRGLACLVADPERPARDAERRRQKDERGHAEGVAMAQEEPPQMASHRVLVPQFLGTRYRLGES